MTSQNNKIIKREKNKGLHQHYYTKKPQGEKRTNTLVVHMFGKDFVFETASGLFSLSDLDTGTRVLLEHAQLPTKGAVLDLGCGWGPVAVIAKTMHSKLLVHATDVNERAVEQTAINAKKNNVDIIAYQSDKFENITESFDCILLNPPQSAGKKLCFELIEQSHVYLNQHGTLQIVARTQKGGKTLAEHMNEVFGNVETVGRKSGFSVYLSKKNNNRIQN